MSEISSIRTAVQRNKWVGLYAFPEHSTVMGYSVRKTYGLQLLRLAMCPDLPTEKHYRPKSNRVSKVSSEDSIRHCSRLWHLCFRMPRKTSWCIVFLTKNGLREALLRLTWQLKPISFCEFTMARLKSACET